MFVHPAVRGLSVLCVAVTFPRRGVDGRTLDLRPRSRRTLTRESMPASRKSLISVREGKLSGGFSCIT